MDPYLGAALCILAASAPAYILMTAWARIDAKRQQDLNYRAQLKAGNYEGGPNAQKPDFVEGLVQGLLMKVLENPELANKLVAAFQGKKE